MSAAQPTLPGSGVTVRILRDDGMTFAGVTLATLLYTPGNASAKLAAATGLSAAEILRARNVNAVMAHQPREPISEGLGWAIYGFPGSLQAFVMRDDGTHLSWGAAAALFTPLAASTILGAISGLSASELARAAAMAGQSSIVSATLGALTVFGDSIPAGAASPTPNYSWVNNLGIAGLSVDNTRSTASRGVYQMAADMPDFTLPAYYINTRSNVFVVQRGTNDLGVASRSAANTYSGGDGNPYIADIVAKAKAAGFYVIVQVPTPRNDGSWNGTKQAQLDALRILINANSAGADAVLDLTLVPELANPNNATYYVDALHPTDAGQNIIRDYYKPIIAALAAMSPRAATVPFTGSYLQLTGLSNMSAPLATGQGWTYSSAITGGYGGPTGVGIATKSLPASTDGYIEFPIGVIGSNGPIVGLQDENTFSGFGTIDAGIFWNPNFTMLPGSAAPGGTVALATWVKINRTGGTMTALLSTNGGATYTLLYTFAGSITARLYAVVLSPQPTAVVPIVRASASFS